MEKIFVEKEFADYVKNARKEFIAKFWKMYPDAKQRVIAENMLIAYEQMAEKFQILKADEWLCIECDQIVPINEISRSKKGNFHKMALGGCGYKVVRVE